MKLSIIDALFENALNNGDQVAFQYLGKGDDNDMLSWKSLVNKAKSVAVKLRQSNLSGDNVLLFYPSGVDFVVSFYGCIMAGVVPVPVYTLDSLRAKKLQPLIHHILKDLEPSAILTTSHIRNTPNLFDCLKSSPLQIITTDNLSQLDTEWLPPNINHNDVAYIQYTSGSTSQPKGVQITHENILDNVKQVTATCFLNKSTKLLTWLPLSHDMGLVAHVLSPVYSCSSQYIISPIAFLKKPIKIIKLISTLNIHMCGGPNFFYKLLNRASLKNEKLDLSCWKIAFCGAEPIDSQVVKEFCKKFSYFNFSENSFSPCYGLAESTSFVTAISGVGPVIFRASRQHLEKNELIVACEGEAHVDLVCSGRMTKNIAIVNMEREVNDEALVGEVWLKGKSVAKGYWNKQHETNLNFHNQLNEDVYLRTGDLGCIKNGLLYITGRIKDLIIINGKNIYPDDIESAIESVNKKIRPGCVAAFSVMDSNNSEHIGIVIGFKGGNEEKAKLKNHVVVALSTQFGVIAEYIHIISPSAVPKTSSGKIQRGACRKLLLNEKSNTGHALEQTEKGNDIITVSTLEGWLVDRVASISTGSLSKEVTIDSDLQELGLDSISQVQLIAELEAKLSKSLSMTLFFQSMTIKELACSLINDSTIKNHGEKSSNLSIYSNIGRLSKIDKRTPNKYQFCIENDIDWSNINDSPLYFPSSFLDDIGILSHDAKITSEQKELLHWALACSICAYIEVLELFLCQFLSTEQNDLIPTESIKWFATEEDKHIHMFRRVHNNLRDSKPDEYKTLSKIWYEKMDTSLYPFKNEFLFPSKAIYHYSCWLLAMFFEEWSVYFGAKILNNSSGINSVWLKVHKLHAREEIQHVLTDAAYIEALDISDSDRYTYSKKIWGWIQSNVFGWLFSGNAIRDFVVGAFPNLKIGTGASLASSSQISDILTSKWFKHTRKAFPYLLELSKVEKFELLDDRMLNSLIPKSWIESNKVQKVRSLNNSICRPLVALTASGQKSPYFLVHSGLGGIEPYISFLPHWDMEYPLYAFEAKGLSDNNEPEPSLHNIAKSYVDSLLKHFPSGPYRLGGYSQGGVIAFLMANELESKGYEVTDLILIDSWLPGSIPVNRLTEEVLIENILLQIQVLGLNINTRELESLTQEKEVMIHIEKLLTPELFKLLERRVAISVLSMLSFQKSLPAELTVNSKIHLLKAISPISVPSISKQNIAIHIEKNDDYGWGEKTLSNLNVYPIVANHFSVCASSLAGAVAKWITNIND